ncbi:MAG TPA: right-handed parallel beta-helix repeat-containing protein [Polyangiaceae bacterium]
MGGASSGGTNTGGAPSGGTTSGTGGSAMPTGGTSGAAPTGGTSGGSTPTGGSGGSAISGGSGGVGTGGAGGPSGGAPSGGSSAGGKAGAGGAMTGGTGGTGSFGSDGDIYIAPDGNDSNMGTRTSPFRTLGHAHDVVTAGKTIWMLPGTYASDRTTTLTKSGSAGSLIVISGTPGNRPLVDFASQPRGANNRGIEVQGNYWQIRGIEIANAGDNGIAISGSHNVVENVVLHDNEDTGLQITVGASQAGDNAYGADNLILNCDSYRNFDHATRGENADGFAAKLRIGPGNVFRGCRAYNNADDGWDLFASNDVVTIENCWAFSNGKVDGQNPAGDGNGFKLGGAPNGTDQGGAVHQVAHNASFENRACGFTRNNNPQVPAASDCKVRDNPSGDYCAMSCSPQSGETMTAAQAIAAPRNADGSLPPIQ